MSFLGCCCTLIPTSGQQRYCGLYGFQFAFISLINVFILAIASWRCVKGRLRKRGEAWQLFNSPPRETPPHLPCTSTQSWNYCTVEHFCTLLHCSQRSSLLNYQPASSCLRDPSLSSSPQPAIITSILTLSALQVDFASDTLQRFHCLRKRVSSKTMMEA